MTTVRLLSIPSKFRQASTLFALAFCATSLAPYGAVTACAAEAESQPSPGVSQSARPAQAEESASTRGLFRVAHLEGEAWSSEPDAQGARKSLTAGEYLKEGSTIYTGARSKLRLLLPGDIALEVQPESEFKLVRKAPSSPDWGAQVERGGILSVVKNPAKRPNHFYIRTRSAAMGVRGTSFYVRSRESDYDFFCACNGTVTLQRPSDSKPEIINSHHHDSPRVVKADETGAILPAQSVNAPLEHTDAELAVLKALLSSSEGEEKDGAHKSHRTPRTNGGASTAR